MKKIDMHCHFYPKEYIDELDRRNLLSVMRPPVWESTEARIADMDRFDVERQVLSPSTPFGYFEDDELTVYLAQLSNDALVDICRKYPNRFSGFINVPLPNIKHAIDELKRLVKAPGIHGVGLGSHIREKPLASPEFTPFFEEVNRLGIPITIHPNFPIGMENVREYKHFYQSVGFLWETTMAVGRMALTGMFERFSNINWILSHLGGALPFVYTSMEMCQKRDVTTWGMGKDEMPPKPLSEYFRRLYVDSARLITAPILACAVDLYGEEHVMFGTDIPYAYDVVSMNIPRLGKLNLPGQFKEKLFYKNAERLLKL